jgi:hypothetical protein
MRTAIRVVMIYRPGMVYVGPAMLRPAVDHEIRRHRLYR